MSEHEWTAPGSARPEPTQPGAAPPGPPPAAPGGYPPPGSYPPGYPPPGGYPAAPPGAGYPPPGGPAYPAPGPGGWQPGYVPAVELRPGIIPLRPLGLGDVYSAVMKTIRGNVGATIGLAFITTLILTVPSTALGAWVGSLADPGSDPYADPYASSADSTFFLGTLSSYIPSLVIAFGSVILTGFVAYVVGQGVLGRRVKAGETWDGTKGRLLSVIGASLLTGFVELAVVGAIMAIPIVLLVTAANGNGSMGGPILLLVLGVVVAIAASLFLWTRFAFPTAAIVLERVGVIAGISRSWRLTSGGQYWRVLGMRFLTAILVSIAGQILAFPISLVAFAGAIGTDNAGHLFVFSAIIAGLTGLITGAITTPFTAGVDAVLYVDQRIRREGLDVHLIAAAQSGAAAPWPAAGQL